MKTKLLSLLVFIFIGVNAKAQWGYGDTINFESPTNVFIKIDTTQPNNLWQIGSPHKIIFDSAYTLPNVIVTDTVNYYPINNTSSFQFTIYDSFLINTGWPEWNSFAPSFQFKHKYNTDSLHDGGYIELSLDSGLTWTNIYTYIPWIYNGGTINGGIPAFTGNSNGWRDFDFGMCYLLSVWGTTPPPSISFRFTFKSDSVNTNKEGWMIDNMFYYNYVCEGIQEYNNPNAVSIFPNPASASITLQSEQKIKKGRMIIYDDTGRKIKTIENINGNNWHLEKENLEKGIYFYRLFNENTFSASGKFVFE